MGLFARIRIRLDASEVRTFAVQASEAVADLRPAFRVIAVNLRGFMRRVFNTEGKELLGQTWQPLAERTVAARRNRWGHYARDSRERPRRRILHWTRALRFSLEQKDAAGHIEAISATSLTFGTEIPYAAATQARRKFLGVTDTFVRTAIAQPISEYIVRGSITGAGRRRTTRLGRTSGPVRLDEAAD